MSLITTIPVIDFILICITLYILLYKYATRNFDYWKKRGVPFVAPVPFFGNLKEAACFKTLIGIQLANLYSQMKTPFFGIFVFDKPCLVIRSPELVKTVLVKDFNHFYDRTVLSDEKNEPLTAHMLFFSKNPEWRTVRSKLTPVFTSGKLKGMLKLINEAGEELKVYLNKHSSNIVCLEAKEICSKYATDVISSCAFGINAHSLESEDSEFRAAGRKIFEFSWKTGIHQTSHFFAHGLVKLFGMKMIDSDASNFLTNVFQSAVKEREKHQQKRNDLVDIIINMKNENQFTNDFGFEGVKVVSQAAQFFVAGFETTSSTIAFTLYELSMNQHIQDKVRTEIKTAMQNHGGCTYEALQSMKYLQQCISETLRKYPVLPFLDRLCNKDYQIPESNVTVDKGTRIYISLFGLHYDPDYFPDPQKYDPDRFSDDCLNTRPSFSYLPFGEGPRNCIGERFGLIATKAALVHTLSEFEVCKGKDTPDVIEFETKSFVLASRIGIPIIFKRIPSKAA